MNLLTKRIKLKLLHKLSYLNSNFALTLGYLNPAFNNSSLKVICSRIAFVTHILRLSFQRDNGTWRSAMGEWLQPWKLPSSKEGTQNRFVLGPVNMEKTCLGRGVIHLPELPWASQLAKLGEALHETVDARNQEMARLGGWSAYENTGAWKEGRSHGWEDNRRALFTIHINMWTVSLDVSIQRRYCQPPSVHLWAYCTHPRCEWCDVWSLTTPLVLRPLLFSNSGVGSFTSHKNQLSVSVVRRDLPTVFFSSLLQYLELTPTWPVKVEASPWL